MAATSAHYYKTNDGWAGALWFHNEVVIAYYTADNGHHWELTYCTDPTKVRLAYAARRLEGKRVSPFVRGELERMYRDGG